MITASLCSTSPHNYNKQGFIRFLDRREAEIVWQHVNTRQVWINDQCLVCQWATVNTGDTVSRTTTSATHTNVAQEDPWPAHDGNLSPAGTQKVWPREDHGRIWVRTGASEPTLSTTGQTTDYTVDSPGQKARPPDTRSPHHATRDLNKTNNITNKPYD